MRCVRLLFKISRMIWKILKGFSRPIINHQQTYESAAHGGIVKHLRINLSTNKAMVTT